MSRSFFKKIKENGKNMAQNFLSPIGFRFALQRAPNIEYYIQAASIPSLTAGFATIQTPFSNLSFSPDKLEYGDFSITFRVDEDMSNYLELHNWLIGITFPDNFTQHNNLVTREQGDNSGIFSDATLTVLNSTKNANVEVQFEDLFPTTISDIQLDVRAADINYSEATATFRYKRFTVAVI